MTVLDVSLTVLPAAAGIWILVYTIKNYRNLRPRQANGFPLPVGKQITVRELARIEGGIRDLVRVVVAAHCVEPPTDELRVAVENNLERRVHYHFLVSGSRGDEEIDGYYQIFRAIAHIVIKRAKLEAKVEDLVTISRLPFEWNHKPHIFYQAKGTHGKLASMVLTGNQKNEGIAEWYERLLPEYAHTIALALLSDAPTPLTVTEEEFQELPSIESDVQEN